MGLPHFAFATFAMTAYHTPPSLPTVACNGTNVRAETPYGNLIGYGRTILAFPKE
ncbi:MAG: hypothetical protein ACI4MS_01730 [Candidatus Coproplasma sp.]